MIDQLTKPELEALVARNRGLIRQIESGQSAPDIRFTHEQRAALLRRLRDYQEALLDRLPRARTVA